MLLLGLSVDRVAAYQGHGVDLVLERTAQVSCDLRLARQIKRDLVAVEKVEESGQSASNSLARKHRVEEHAASRAGGVESDRVVDRNRAVCYSDVPSTLTD